VSAWRAKLTFTEEPANQPGGETESLSVTYRYNAPKPHQLNVAELTRDEVLVNAGSRVMRRFGKVTILSIEVEEILGEEEESAESPA